MSKIFKSIVATAAAALTVGIFSIGAAASQSDEGTTSFNTRIPDRGEKKSGPITKTNDETYATVTLHGTSTASANTPIQFRVYRQGVSFAVTPIVSMTALGDKELDYETGMGVNGKQYTLYMNVGYYGATADGTWTA